MKPEINDSIFRTLFDHALEGMIVIDENGKIRLANSKAEELFGYFEGELASKSIEAF